MSFFDSLGNFLSDTHDKLEKHNERVKRYKDKLDSLSDEEYERRLDSIRNHGFKSSNLSETEAWYKSIKERKSSN